MSSDSKNRPLVNVFVDESMETALSGFLALKEDVRREAVKNLRAFTYFINHLISDKESTLNLASIFDAPQLHVLGESNWIAKFRHRVWLLDETYRHALREKLEEITPECIADYRQANILIECLSSPSGEDLQLHIANHDVNQGDDESQLKVNVAPVLQACLLLMNANPEDYFLATRLNKVGRDGTFDVIYESQLIYPHSVIVVPDISEMDKGFLHDMVEEYQGNDLMYYYEWAFSKPYKHYQDHDYYAKLTVKGSKKAYDALFALQHVMRRSIYAVDLNNFSEKNALYVDYMFNEASKQCYPVLSCFVESQLAQFQGNPLFKAHYDEVKNALLQGSNSASEYEDAVLLFHAALYHCAQYMFASALGQRSGIEFADYVEMEVDGENVDVQMEYDNEENGYVINIGSIDYPEFSLYMSQLALMLDRDNDSFTIQSVYKHAMSGLHHRLATSKGYALIAHHELMREYLDAYPPQPEKTKQLKEDAMKEAPLSIA